MDITVDQLGNVVNAISGVKGSTTLNSQLLKRAKEASVIITREHWSQYSIYQPHN